MKSYFNLYILISEVEIIVLRQNSKMPWGVKLGGGYGTNKKLELDKVI